MSRGGNADLLAHSLAHVASVPQGVFHPTDTHICSVDRARRVRGCHRRSSCFVLSRCCCSQSESPRRTQNPAGRNASAPECHKKKKQQHANARCAACNTSRARLVLLHRWWRSHNPAPHRTVRSARCGLNVKLSRSRMVNKYKIFSAPPETRRCCCHASSDLKTGDFLRNTCLFSAGAQDQQCAGRPRGCSEC